MDGIDILKTVKKDKNPECARCHHLGGMGIIEIGGPRRSKQGCYDFIEKL